MSDTPSRVSPSATRVESAPYGPPNIQLRDALNEYEYVIGNAPDEASRRAARKVVEEIFCEMSSALDRTLRDLSAAESPPLRSPSSPVPSSPPEWAHEDFIRDMPSRGTEPEDFEKLLDTMMHEEGLSASNFSPARAAIRGYVSRLQSERDALHERMTEEASYAEGRCDQCEEPIEVWRTVGGYLKAYDRDAGDPVPHDCKRVSELRSQLSRIQQTGLTAEEAAVVLEASEYRTIAMDKMPAWYSATSKLRSLAALRSLEGDRGK